MCAQVVSEMKDLVSRYDAAVVEEQELSPEKRIVANVGKMDAKKHLAANVTSVMSSNINQVGGDSVGGGCLWCLYAVLLVGVGDAVLFVGVGDGVANIGDRGAGMPARWMH
jgi:pantothenate kinase